MHVADAFVRVASPLCSNVAVRRCCSNIVSNCSTQTRYTIDCPATDPEKLQQTVTKHVQTLDRFLESRFIANHTAAAFEELSQALPSQCGDIAYNIILDSGCGTGRSSLLLGQQYPECTVIGVDRSLARLSKQPYLFDSKKNDEDDDTDDKRLVYQAASNVWLVRAELVDFWRLLLQDKSRYQVTRHYLLYPNPYPKPKRFKSRWYANPSFPLLLSIASETTIVRSNWELYLQEFAAATKYVSDQSSNSYCLDLDPVETIQPFSTNALSNFEQKYWDVGEPTFELVLRR